MSELDISIVTIFKQYYPTIDHTTLDSNVLAMLIENMFAIEKTKYSDSETDSDSDTESNPIIEENYLMATELIPELIEPGDLIVTKGKLNKVPVNILFDSGCQCSTTFTSVIKQAKLQDLVDKSAITYSNGIGGPTSTCGIIWYTELEFDIGSNITINLPIKLSILDKPNNSIDILLGTDFLKLNNGIIDFNQKIIRLGEHIINY